MNRHHWSILVPIEIQVQCNEDGEFHASLPRKIELSLNVNETVNSGDIICRLCNARVTEGFGKECTPNEG